MILADSVQPSKNALITDATQEIIVEIAEIVLICLIHNALTISVLFLSILAVNVLFSKSVLTDNAILGTIAEQMLIVVIWIIQCVLGISVLFVHLLP